MKRIMLFLLMLSMPAACADGSDSFDFEKNNEEIFENDEGDQDQDSDNEMIASEQEAQAYEDEIESMDNSPFGFFVQDDKELELDGAKNEDKQSELKSENDEEENSENNN